MYQSALVSGFVNILVYFKKLANNFKPLDRFFKKIKILEMWWQFFQNFVFSDVVYDQTGEVLTLKNCIEPP